MATRKRRTDAGKKRDLPVEGRDKKDKDKDKDTVTPKYNTDRKMTWDEEGKNLQTDRSYGSGNSTEHPEREDDYTDPRPYHNYDDFVTPYTPSQR